jgi:hypothetical protein
MLPLHELQAAVADSVLHGADAMDPNFELIAALSAHLTRGTFSDLLVSDETAGAVP